MWEAAASRFHQKFIWKLANNYGNDEKVRSENYLQEATVKSPGELSSILSFS